LTAVATDHPWLRPAGMELVHRYRGAYAFVDGQPCRIMDVVVAGPGKSGHMAAVCRLRNLMTNACSENVCHHSYQLFTPEKRVYRLKGHTGDPCMLHLEDDLGVLDMAVGDSRVNQWVWEALQGKLDRQPDEQATVTLLVMKNPGPREGEQRLFYRITDAYVLTQGRKTLINVAV
jgi:hypothetical protein